MEKLTFTRVNLSDVRVIMMIMCVSVVELLCQVATRQITVLKYLLSGAHGCLWPCLIMQELNVATSRGPDSRGAPVVLTQY
jgi:hypothetical protein